MDFLNALGLSCARGASIADVIRWTFLASTLWSLGTLADKTAADYYVHSLPGAPDGTLLKMHAGYVPRDLLLLPATKANGSL